MLGVAAALENHTLDEAMRASLMETALQGARVDCGRGNGRPRAEFPEFVDMLMAKLKEVISKVSLLAYFESHPSHSP